MDTKISRTSLHVTADIEVDQTVGFPVPRPEEDQTIRITGRVVQARTGTGLPGLRVVALAATGSEAVLGSGVSNPDGWCRIGFDDCPETAERLVAFRNLPDRQVRLQVETADGRNLATSGPFSLDRSELEVSVPVPLPEVEVSPQLWTALGEALESARIAHLSDVVQLLSADGVAGTSPSPESEEGIGSISEIPMLSRQAMLGQLEEAFLDPVGALRRAAGSVPTLQEMHDPDTAEDYARRLQAHLDEPEVRAAYGELLGKAAAFSHLGAVDWVIDPEPMVDGAIGPALGRFSDNYKLGGRFDLLPLFRDNRTLYRDYLLDIWTKYASKVVYVQGVNLSEADALEQLENRFHQRFTTNDSAQVVANTVLLGIARDILTAPTGGGWGFGVAPGAIPAQGADSPRVYLDKLIALTGLSARELGLRYRLDFTRPDSVLSSTVDENIATLQGFFRDSFQCALERFHVDPDKNNQPIIPDIWQGNAPFFLYYDEWLRQRAPFYPENHLDVRRTLPVEISDEARRRLVDLAAGNVPGESANQVLWKFCQRVVVVWDRLQAGNAHYYAGEYALARVEYREARGIALSAMDDNILRSSSIPVAKVDFRKKLPLRSMKDLPRFMKPSELDAGGFMGRTDPGWARDHMGLRLAYYALYTIPVCLGDAELALGDYEQAVFHYGQATRFAVGIARESDSGGYRPGYGRDFQMYWRGDKPYSVDLTRGFRIGGEFHEYGADDARYPAEKDDRAYDDFFGARTMDAIEQLAVEWSKRIAHQAEMKRFRFQQANAMLEWADALYRLNEPTPMARARELYKGVLWLHGQHPPTCPEWPQELGLRQPPPFFFHHVENPALLSQTGRAERGIYQIDRGLNYYGERDDIVPILRYRPLKDTADRMAAMARGAQQDFVHYTERVEAAITAKLQLANFLRKSKLQATIADEQTAIAQHDVQVARGQVVAVQEAIKSKQDEIAKADSLFGQFEAAFKSVKSMVDSLPDDTKSAVSAGILSEATGKQMVGKGMLGLGAGASVMTGVAIFAVMGYMTLDGMADASKKQSADLRTLMDRALPAAEAAVEARGHGVNITRYMRQIAQADVDLAQTLMALEQNRTLNFSFWNEMARIARRLLRRYIELGARVSWLAERALAYEQDRILKVVRMDYFPARLQGVSGADLMMADLAELESARIEGMKRAVPVRRTLSLARDFPMAYGQLKRTGRCAFRTEEAVFRMAHPGTAAYRIRAVSATVQQVSMTQPLRGSLIDLGVSISKPGLADEHVLVRPADSLPLTEFRLERDMAVYGLPNESLLTFEGSSVETFWELSFPPAANPTGLDGLADVLLTFDLFAEFAPDRYGPDLAALPTTTRKWVLVAAAKYAPAGLADLAGAAPSAVLEYDMRRVKLPRQEKTRAIKNVGILAIAPDQLDFKAKLLSSSPATSVEVELEDGFVISSLQPDPLLPPLPVSPLNAFADQDAEQTFTLAIDKVSNPGVDFAHVTDVVLALEYEASLV